MILHLSAAAWTVSLVIAAAVVAARPASAAATLDTRVDARCRLGAYGADTDRAGSNLRAGPSLRAGLVGRLPPLRRESDSRTIAADFDVVGSRDGWFLIENVTHPTYLEGRHDVAYPKLRGWIAAGLVTVQIGSSSLRAGPRAKADTVAVLTGTSPDGSWGPDSVTVERAFGCSGSFVDVAIRMPDGRRARGWASGVCNNQVTTCDASGNPWEDRGGELVVPEP